MSNNLEEYGTAQLIDELEHRYGVEVRIVADYREESIPVEGPAIVLIIKE